MPSALITLLKFLKDGAGSSTHPGSELAARTLIWGTTVNISDAMDAFKNFVQTFSTDPMEDAYYIQKLKEVFNARSLRLISTEAFV